MQQAPARRSGPPRALPPSGARPAPPGPLCSPRRAPRRAYASRRGDHDSTRHEMLLGEASHSTRRDNLCAAWALIHQHSLLHEEARRAWPRKVSPPE